MGPDRPIEPSSVTFSVKCSTLSHIRLSATPWTVCSSPGSCVHGILQTRTLEWAAIPFSRGIFPTKRLNLGLLHCRQGLHCLSHQGSPFSQYMTVSWNSYLTSLYSSFIICKRQHVYDRITTRIKTLTK